jgi:hypothetical protein
MQSTKRFQILFIQLLVLIHLPQQSYSFTVLSIVPSTRTRISKVHQVPFAATNDNNDTSDTNDTGLTEAEQLLAKAKAIRTALAVEEKENKSLPPRTNNNASYMSETKKVLSPFNVNNDDDSNNCESVGYRLYLDIGREDGTWMDPRWGASGKRIECSIDVSFLMPMAMSMNNDNDNNDKNKDTSLAGEEIIDQMVKDNLSGKSSNVRILQSATKARLRGGFDEMSVNSGGSSNSVSNSSSSISNSSGYRIDAGGNRNSSNTMRFYLNVEGTGDANSEYGDISIPEGNLYFSLPCFGNNAKQLSNKEGIVTVRQFGWHTGWRREESRIIGVFRAVPIDQAKKRDRF